MYVPTLYTGAARIEEAQQIFMSAGQELLDLEIRLRAAESRTVRGRVIQPDGSRVQGSLQITPISSIGEIADLRASLFVPPAPDGTFEVRDVVDGQYLLLLTGFIPSVRWQGPLQAQVITIGEETPDLEVMVDPPARLEGRVRLADGTAPPFDPRTLNIVTEQRWPGGTYSPGGQPQYVRPDGTFTIHSPAREVWFSVRGLPMPWTLESAYLDGASITDAPFTLGPGSSHTVDVIVSNRAGSVTGRVADRRGRPIPEALVVLFAQERSLWTVARWTHTASSRVDGSYAIDHVIPGEYRAVAVSTLPPKAWNSPEVLELLWASSVPVHVGAKQSATETLTVTAPPPGVLEP